MEGWHGRPAWRVDGWSCCFMLSQSDWGSLVGSPRAAYKISYHIISCGHAIDNKNNQVIGAVFNVWQPKTCLSGAKCGGRGWSSRSTKQVAAPPKEPTAQWLRIDPPRNHDPPAEAASTVGRGCLGSCDGHDCRCKAKADTPGQKRKG